MDSSPYFSSLDTARRVLNLQAQALHAMAGALVSSFDRAVQTLADVSGRVIVFRMGKSGHIGRKIAATLAFTGTPAQSVHPGKASHGDLGMISSGYAVLALSNSGKTPELDDLVAHARRFGIPLISITGRGTSALARDADVALVLPQAGEACPLGLAPTTSTTMQLAMGDALAVALLTRSPRTIGPDLLAAEALRVMNEGSITALFVVDGAGRPLGILHVHDQLRAGVV